MQLNASNHHIVLSIKEFYQDLYQDILKQQRDLKREINEPLLILAYTLIWIGKTWDIKPENIHISQEGNPSLFSKLNGDKTISREIFEPVWIDNGEGLVPIRYILKYNIIAPWVFFVNLELEEKLRHHFNHHFDTLPLPFNKRLSRIECLHIDQFRCLLRLFKD